MTAVLTALGCVILLNLYAAVLIVLRAKAFDEMLYRPMLLNIGLSLAPVALAVGALVGLLVAAPLLGRLGEISAALPVVVLWFYLVVAVMVWLVFFPNSVYLITELNFSHRSAQTSVPLWYDIVQTLALTVSGLANAVLSLALIQFGLVVLVDDPSGRSAPPAWSWLLGGAVIVLGAVGVYLGRYLRLNTWDLSHPAALLRKVRDHFRPRGRTPEALAFVLTHAVLVALLYVPVFAMAYGAILG